jgi:hypothetical protein
MNGRTFAGITLLISLVASCPATALAAGPGPYEIKSGMIETVSEAFGSSTTQEYFDDFGVKNAKYTTTTVMGQTTRKLEIHLPDGASYDIDLDQKSGTLMRLPPEAAAALGAAMAPQMMKDAKVKPLPAKQLLGKACEGKQYDAMGTVMRVWSWKGLPLYTEMGQQPGAMVIRATRVSEEAVPADRFAVPAGVRIQNLSQ